MVASSSSSPTSPSSPKAPFPEYHVSTSSSPTVASPSRTPSVMEAGTYSRRPRGHSTSTIRGPPSLSAVPSLTTSSTSLMTVPPVHAPPVSRVISNPIPPSISSNRPRSNFQVAFPNMPPSAASTVSYSTASPYPFSGGGNGRSGSRVRAMSFTGRDRSRGSFSEGAGRGRSKSPLRDLALSLSSLGRRKPGSGERTPSSMYSDTRPATLGSEHGDESDSQFVGRLERWNAARSSWWHSHSPRLFSERVKRKEPVSAEQLQGWMRVKELVEQATTKLLPSPETAREALDMTLEVTHELLDIGADVLQFAPVVGLSEAARVLVNIWDAVQMVDLNQLACLRLTERCANILISVQQEIEEADGLASRSQHSSPPKLEARHPGSSGSVTLSGKGSPQKVHMPLTGSPRRAPSPLASGQVYPEGEDETPRIRDGKKKLPSEAGDSKPTTPRRVHDELKAPMDKLTSAFNHILGLLEKQNRRPFLKRYLKRDEIREELLACDALLSDAMSMFSVSIQVKILNQLMQAEEQRQADHNALVDRILNSPATLSPPLPPYEPLSPEQVTAGGSLLFENVPLASPTSAIEEGGTNTLDLNLSAPGQPPPIGPKHPVHPKQLSQSEVLDQITHYTTAQNEYDFAHDAAYLRQLMSSALATNDDMEMIRVLQVSKEEMPEALKALQRALEAEVDKERDELAAFEGESVGSVQGIVDGIVGSRASVQGPGGAERKDTFDSSHSRTSTASQATSSHTHSSKDTLHREFLESGIDTLRRLSLSTGMTPSSLSLPPWTITRYEVDKDVQIGVGFFSSVWRGSYRGRTVAIKILAPWTPKEMFMREVLVWHTLKHRNVLELIGASAIDVNEESDHMEEGGWPDEDGSPWFFVSRYYQRGSLIKWVKSMSNDAWASMLDDVSSGVLRMVHEISQGMAYLHSRGALHGDLKCANVLIDDNGHCIISDFGQSEMKSEAYRLSGTPVTHGTLRWQAPELMAGESTLTQAIDVYAFAISCIEILTKGGMPWHSSDDEAVRYFVLKEDRRPEPPHLRPWSPSLAEVIHQCWARDPDLRPSFEAVASQLDTIRRRFGWDGTDDLLSQIAEDPDWLDGTTRISPDMNPVPLPLLPADVTCVDVPSFSSDDSFATAKEQTSRLREESNDSSGMLLPHPTIPHESVSAPLQSRPPSIASAEHPNWSAPGAIESSNVQPDVPGTRTSSLVLTDHSSDYADIIGSPVDMSVAEIRNEKGYRMLLQHEYHSSLILPLWTPSHVDIGAVGYHSRPSGTFVTLLNAFSPMESSGGKARDMPSLFGFGPVPLGNQKLEKRNVARRSMDLIQGWISRGKSDTRSISRRYSAPLRTGHKTAHLFVETAEYRFMPDDTPKRWFHANVEQLLKLYGQEHGIQKEDIMLVIGALDAAAYALFVSHNHPDGQVNFNVFSSAKPGQTWGEFSTTTESSMTIPGPIYNEPVPIPLSESKVSVVKRTTEPWDTVLIARLRFPPDKDIPTSL